MHAIIAPNDATQLLFIDPIAINPVAHVTLKPSSTSIRWMAGETLMSIFKDRWLTEIESYVLMHRLYISDDRSPLFAAEVHPRVNF